jgi:hypothetical protein
MAKKNTKPKQAPKPKQPTFKFYVIQNKEDKKFYTENCAYIAPYRKETWTDDLKRVRVFRTKSGAKCSRGYVQTVRRETTSCQNCSPNEQTIQHRIQYEKNYGHRFIFSPARCYHWEYVKVPDEELPYKIVEITATI